jgi:lipopolysaccharide export system protein LptC
MAAPLQRYSRLVFWLKILLPILALAILSTLFLFARRIGIDGVLPYAQVEVDRLARDPRLTAPEYKGVTDDGSAVTFVATTAYPGKTSGDPIRTDNPSALYDAKNGSQTTVAAKDGIYDSTAGLVTLITDVVVKTADGYNLQADHMLSSLKTSLITAEGKVIADAPFGKIEAGAMRLSGPPDDHLLVFNKGVRLVYTP